jgi:putative acetyltransferase
VEIIDGRVVGFTDLDDDGYVDMLFVDRDFGRQGVATSMQAVTLALARQRWTVALTTYASLTAKPLFERHGFVVTVASEIRCKSIGVIPASWSGYSMVLTLCG